MKQLLLISFIVLLIGCAGERDFPEVKKLSDYKKTDFVTTPQNKLQKGATTVYSVSLLLAWQQVKELAEQEIKIDADYRNLSMLNNSESYKNTLQEGEYESYANFNIEEGTISARAEFSKSLPLAIKLKSFDNELTFKGEKVKSFGLMGPDYKLLGAMQILYYKNDENFIVKLFPRDNTHEIILYRCEKQPGTIQEGFDIIEKLIKTGKSERNISKNFWKYHFENDEDELLIPKFSFNIESNYDTMQQNSFILKEQRYTVEKIWQRTAFILDESGAEIESEAEIEVTTEAEIEPVEKPHSKKMHFDKPFLILLKRTDSSNPYFAMWIDNTELMQK